MNFTQDFVSERPFVRRSLRMRAMLVALLAAGCCGGASAGFLVVPNGDFSDAANAGSVGGGVLGASGTNVPIGSGPWTATYNGVLGLLAPPVLEINSVNKTAVIDGLLGVNALGIVNNGGHFGQTLSSNWQPTKRYTLIANLDTGVVLDLPLLSAAGTGIMLLSNTGPIASSTTAAATHVRADTIDALTARIALTHDTGAIASGPITVQLFDRPQGLLTAGLIDTAEYSGVRLAQSTIPPGNSTLTVSGGGSQGAALGQPFPFAMKALVKDQNNNPVPDVLVTLEAPATGPSATLYGTGGQVGRVVVAFTDSNGEVTLTADANNIAGCYKVTGSVIGMDGQAGFNLRNFSAAQIQALRDAGADVDGVMQDSVYCNGFE